MNKLSVDDKGTAGRRLVSRPWLTKTTRHAACNLPWISRSGWRDLNARHAIGVTTGRAFCGVVGDSTRREYTMIGDVRKPRRQN